MARSAKKVIPKELKTSAVKAEAKASAAAKKRRAPSFTARTAKEITATFHDSVGLTARVAAALAADNVNILAGTGFSASGIRTRATFTLIVDDLARAERALEKLDADDIQDSSVVIVETSNKVGALERISGIIAEAGINIYYFYSTTNSGSKASCVFKTADDRKAIKVLTAA